MRANAHAAAGAVGVVGRAAVCGGVVDGGVGGVAGGVEGVGVCEVSVVVILMGRG